MTCFRLFRILMICFVTAPLFPRASSAAVILGRCADLFEPKVEAPVEAKRPAALERIISKYLLPENSSPARPHGMEKHLSFETLSPGETSSSVIAGTSFLRLSAKEPAVDEIAAKVAAGAFLEFMSNFDFIKVRFVFTFPDSETPIFVDLIPTRVADRTQLMIRSDRKTVLLPINAEADLLKRQLDAVAAVTRLQSDR